MELLSGIGAGAPQAIVHRHVVQHATAHQPAHVPAAGVALSLSGTVQGTYRAAPGNTAASFSGRGAISPAGNARLQGRIAVAASGGGALTLTFGRRGKIFAAVTGATPTSTNSYQITYQITGGTRQFAGDTGGGSAVVQILSAVGARPHGRFLLSLQPIG
jgi:hypothetical protein